MPLVGVYDKVEDMNFSEFPNKFVLKANQSSGYNLVVKEKNDLDIQGVKSKPKQWLEIDYSLFGEWQYKGIKNKIIIEKFIDNNDENPLLDY